MCLNKICLSDNLTCLEVVRHISLSLVPCRCSSCMLNHWSVGMLCHGMAQALYLLSVKTMSVILLE